MNILNVLALIATILGGIAILISFLNWLIKKLCFGKARAVLKILTIKKNLSSDGILLKSLNKIKYQTKTLFPILKSSLINEEEYVEADILNSTLKKIMDDLEIFRSRRIWEYTLALSDYNKLKELFQKL